jgi:hypothetical protein
VNEKNYCIWKKNCISVVGQEEAIEAVSDAVRRRAPDYKDMRKPVGTFLSLEQQELENRIGKSIGRIPI